MLLPVTAVLGFLLGGLSFSEYGKPDTEWKKYQKKYYKEQLIKTKKEYKASTSVEEKELLGKRLKSLKNPVYGIKQIFLNSKTDWAENISGDKVESDKVENCMTCHIDEEKLKTSHSA